MQAGPDPPAACARQSPGRLGYDFGMRMKEISGPVSIVLALALIAGATACAGSSREPRSAPTGTLLPTSTALPDPSPTATATLTPAPSSSSTPDCQPGVGTLESGRYSGAVISEEVPYQIYLPDCFQEGRVLLPVMYFFHGKPYDENHWIELSVISEYQAGVRSGGWGEAVLVFAYLPEPLFSQTDGGPGSYEQEFLDGLLPAIEARYPAGGAANRRILAGISRGGIWSLEIGLANPGLAARVAALSPSLAVNYPRAAFDPFELARSNVEGSVNVYLLAGEQDWARGETERLAGVLRENGRQVELVILPGEHSDSTWHAGLESLFDFALGGARPGTSLGPAVD